MPQKIRQLKLTSAEIAQLLACSDSYARRVIREIKAKYGKEKDQFITVFEFANFYKLQLFEVYDALDWELPRSLREKQK